jgi:hypothetical protein
VNRKILNSVEVLRSLCNVWVEPLLTVLRVDKRRKAESLEQPSTSRVSSVVKGGGVEITVSQKDRNSAANDSDIYLTLHIIKLHKITTGC